MGYEKNTWKSGDVVTSAKLNNLEAGSVAVYHFTASDDNPYQFELDATFREVYDALKSGVPVLATLNQPSGAPNVYVATYAELSDELGSERASINFTGDGTNNFSLTTSDPDEYPSTVWD